MPVTHSVAADWMWMKLVGMMNVRLRSRGKDERLIEGCGEQPVMWKMESVGEEKLIAKLPYLEEKFLKNMLLFFLPVSDIS